MTTSASFEQELSLKVQLLCKGVRKGEFENDILAKQSYYYKRIGDLGLQLLIGESQLVANFPIDQSYPERSPYTLVKNQDECVVLFENDQEMGVTKVIQPPDWNTKRSPMGSIMLQEGKHALITAIFNGCEFFKNDEHCRFCSINLYVGHRHGVFVKSPEQIDECVKRATRNCPDYIAKHYAFSS